MSFVLADSLGTKPCVFPCKVAPAGDGRYLMCAAVAAGVAVMFSFCRSGMWLPAAVDALV